MRAVPFRPGPSPCRYSHSRGVIGLRGPTTVRLFLRRTTLELRRYAQRVITDRLPGNDPCGSLCPGGRRCLECSRQEIGNASLGPQCRLRLRPQREPHRHSPRGVLHHGGGHERRGRPPGNGWDEQQNGPRRQPHRKPERQRRHQRYGERAAPCSESQGIAASRAAERPARPGGITAIAAARSIRPAERAGTAPAA